MITKEKEITKTQYGVLDNAFDFLNKKLFDGKLPACVITFNRHNKATGFFCDSRFASKSKKEDRADEIALNPDCFNRPEKEILATLAHEMAHMWQARFGKPSRTGYHNKEWGNKMISIGLQPVTPEGEEVLTGAKIGTKIIKDGLFDSVTKEMTKIILWESLPIVEKAKAKRKNKIKYTCPACQANVWGKSGMHIECTDCGEMFEEMESEDDNE